MHATFGWTVKSLFINIAVHVGGDPEAEREPEREEEQRADPDNIPEAIEVIPAVSYRA